MSGPLQSSPAQINSHLTPRLVHIDSKSSIFYFLSEFTGTHADGKIANLPVWGPGYEISFEFYLNSDGGTSAYQWLFGVIGGGTDYSGYGQPCVFYKAGKLPMWFRLNDNKYGQGYGAGTTMDLWYYPYGGSVTVDVKKWHHLSISSVKENGKVCRLFSMHLF